MQDEIWHQRSIQNYNGAVLSVYSVVVTYSLSFDLRLIQKSKWPNIRSRKSIPKFSLDSVDIIYAFMTLLYSGLSFYDFENHIGQIFSNYFQLMLRLFSVYLKFHIIIHSNPKHLTPN